MASHGFVTAVALHSVDTPVALSGPPQERPQSFTNAAPRDGGWRRRSCVSRT